MAKIAGVDVLVKIGTSIIGGQSGATLNRSTDLIEATSKDSNGWQENLAGFKNWSVDCEGFLIESDISLTSLETAWINGDSVMIEIALPSGKKYSGSAFVTDFPMEAPQDDAVTYSVTFQGSGALTITPAV